MVAPIARVVLGGGFQGKGLAGVIGEPGSKPAQVRQICTDGLSAKIATLQVLAEFPYESFSRLIVCGHLNPPFHIILGRKPINLPGSLHLAASSNLHRRFLLRRKSNGLPL